MSNICTQPLNIKLDNHISQSYLAYPTGQKNSVPGILVFSEFWGLTQQTKSRAENLAKLGYCALAVDVYGEGWIGDTCEEATSAMNKLLSNMEKVSTQMEVYLQTLKNLKQTDEQKIASIGYCLGGTLSLDLARRGGDIKGVVSFHGNLTPHVAIKPDTVKAKVLICHGEADILIPDTQIKNFKTEMELANVDYNIVTYPEAQHGFTNPGATQKGKEFNIPISYNQKADQNSWQDMLNFLNKIF